jgi:hypothetical protein
MIDAACFTSPPNKKKEQAASMELSKQEEKMLESVL